MATYSVDRTTELTVEISFEYDGDFSDLTVIICGPKGLRIPATGPLAKLLAGNLDDRLAEAMEDD